MKVFMNTGWYGKYSTTKIMKMWERPKFLRWGVYRFRPVVSFLWLSRTFARKLFTGRLIIFWKTLPVILFFLFVIISTVAADVTLEILDFRFPGNCGALKNEDLGSCPRCHALPEPDAGTEKDQFDVSKSTVSHMTITSLEEKGRITVSVPSGTLNPGQPFAQDISFTGHTIMYQYGYRMDKGPFKLLDSNWILNTTEHTFSEKHDGTSLPLLQEPGEYVFMVKLLHDRNEKSKDDFQWAEVVLLWTVSVVDNTWQ